MARTLGVHCAPQYALLALVVDGALQPEPERLEWPVSEESERLGVTFRDAKAMMNEQNLDRVVILLPERGPRTQWTYNTLAPRVALETVLRLAAVETGRPVAMMDRRTVRARLDCGSSGSLDDYLEQVITAPVGRYWKLGRGLAAMAALAAERG